MPDHVVREPDDGERLRHVVPADDEENGHVADADRQAVLDVQGALAQQDYVADYGEGDAADCESVAVLDLVGPPGAEEGEDCADGVDGDGV